MTIPTQDPADTAAMRSLKAAIQREWPGFETTVVVWAMPPIIVLRMKVLRGVGKVLIEVPLTTLADPANLGSGIAVRDEDDVIEDIDAAIRFGTHFGVLRCEPHQDATEPS